MSNDFTWWHVIDGVAVAVPDTPAARAIIDADGRGYYGSIEGAILNGGVIATAFKRKTARTYDAAQWLRTGELVPAGEITTTEITAQREQS
jgi:hypothetical protein